MPIESQARGSKGADETFTSLGEWIEARGRNEEVGEYG
jgi:hypothetical protein